MTRPARTSGCATSQRRNGRFVVTPPTSVSRSAAASRSNASSRVSPAAMSFAIIGSYDVPISSPSRDAGVDAYALRKPQPLELAGLRQERARILRIQPHLDRATTQVTTCHEVRERFAARDAELFAHEVDAGHELRHRMLDLDPRVELEEEEVAAVEDELRGAGALVADRARERDGGVAHPLAQLGVERGGGRLLEHLLVAALDRAVALAERDDVAVRVGEDLDLDVARALEVALAEDRVVAERRARLAPRSVERVRELGLASARRACRARRRPPPPSRAAGSRSPPACRSAGRARPPRRAVSFAASLSPPARSAAGGGPIHVRPASSTASANSALSERKP